MYKSLVPLKGRNGQYIVPSLTFWFFCVKTKEHILKKITNLSASCNFRFLRFFAFDAKKVSKEKSRQTQWLRLFCHASATPCGIVVKGVVIWQLISGSLINWLIWGCDYPHNTTKDLKHRTKSRSKKVGMFA